MVSAAYCAYVAATTAATFALTPGLLVGAAFDRWGLRERFFGPPPRVVPTGGVVWLHAASVGEVRAIAPLVGLLVDEDGVNPLVSTATETGRTAAEAVLAGRGCAALVPWDWPPVIRRFTERAAPCALLIAETELWPSLMSVVQSRGLGMAIVNGRMRPRSFARYWRARGLLGPLLARCGLICTQSEADAAQFCALGASSDAVEVVGNLKFDAAREAARTSDPATARTAAREMLGLRQDELFVLAASTREGEVETMLTACPERARGANVVLGMAPRYPDNVPALIRLLLRLDKRWVRRTALAQGTPRPQGHRVIVIDTLGELPELYRAADLAVVGGTFVPIGGHNPLEPAATGVPVIFGPHMEQTGADRLEAAGGAIRVADRESLARAVQTLLDDPVQRHACATAARRVVTEGAGVAVRTLALLRERGIL